MAVYLLAEKSIPAESNAALSYAYFSAFLGVATEAIAGTETLAFRAKMDEWDTPFRKNIRERIRCCTGRDSAAVPESDLKT